jgi:hypothetical protein
MLGFIQTKEQVYTFECIPVDRENIIVYYWRVATEGKYGNMVKSKWRQGSMSPEGTGMLAAQKLKGILYPIKLTDAEYKEMITRITKEVLS